VKNFIVILLVVGLISTVSAQFKLASITTSLGKGSVTSGYDINLTFVQENDNKLSIVGNHTRAYAAYCWPHDVISVSASGGFFKNTPWGGPKIVITPTEFLSTLHWLAIGAGEPEHPAWKVKMLFGFNALLVKIGNFQVSYSLLHFLQNKPEHIPGTFYGNNLGDNWSYSVGVEYNLNTSEPLFQGSLKKTL